MIKKQRRKLDEDLGFGEKVIEENQSRFINRDGSLNIYKKGSSFSSHISFYHAVLNASWLEFFVYILFIYFAVNSIFTFLYLLTGPKSFPEIANLDIFTRAEEIFFFSIQILTTLGSSPLHPYNLWAHVILSLEAMVGIIGFSLGAGLIFARFSNPAIRIVFSRNAIIAPYENGKAFMFRIINERNNDLIDVDAIVTLSMIKKSGKRTFKRLKLERDNISVFPLSWTVVHPIDEESPLYKMTQKDMENCKVEFLINITATDTDLGREIHSRFSYLHNEIIMGAKFTNIIEHERNGRVIVDPKKIHDIETI